MSDYWTQNIQSEKCLSENLGNKIVKQLPYNPYIVFDIDGTLANIKHRLCYLDKTLKNKPDWQSFNDAMINDEINLHIAAIYHKMCNNLHSSNNPAIFVTGRPETHRQQTENWLLKHKLIPNYLFMRPAGDYRTDVEIKQDIVLKYIKEAPILFVVDDRDAVVTMWRQLGYKCLQCQKGDY